MRGMMRGMLGRGMLGGFRVGVRVFSRMERGIRIRIRTGLWVDGGGSGFWHVELLRLVKGRWGGLSRCWGKRVSREGRVGDGWMCGGFEDVRRVYGRDGMCGWGREGDGG